MPQQQPASGLTSMAPIANGGCAYDQTGQIPRLWWCPRVLLMLESRCPERLALPLGSCDVWAGTACEGMVCVHGLAVAGVCDNVNGLCCHRRSQEPNMLKSEAYAEPALLLNVWSGPILNTAAGELAPIFMLKPLEDLLVYVEFLSLLIYCNYPSHLITLTSVISNASRSRYRCTSLKRQEQVISQH